MALRSFGLWRLLRFLPPETAHNITIWLLEKLENYCLWRDDLENRP